MKIKWNGITPVNNIFGEWQPGQIKEVPEIIIIPGFQIVSETPVENIPKRKLTRRKMREDLNNKFERDNLETRE
jgi:hypothetical protein